MYNHRLRLTLLGERLAIARLAATAEIPEWAWIGTVVSVTRTQSELSVVCAESAVPDGVRAERGWRALALPGPIPFSATGVLAAITAPLGAAKISVFAISTYDTDLVLVRENDLGGAITALNRAGHVLDPPVLGLNDETAEDQWRDDGKA